MLGLLCSLHLTTMCLQYRPTLVACVCIHLACKWSSWEVSEKVNKKGVKGVFDVIDVAE